MLFAISHYCLFLIPTPSLIQEITRHTQSKDKFHRVCIKWLFKAQNFEDKLKQASALNETLLAQNPQLKLQLAEERRGKASKHLHNPF
jgi:hypothetical protein